MEKINFSFKALLKDAAIAVIILLLSSTAWSKSLHESEPNDAIEEANELRPGQSIQGLFQIEDDEDWYKLHVSVKDKTIVTVELTEVPGIDSILEIYDADGESLKYSNMGDEGETEAIFRFGVVKGVYYIRAYAYNGENTKNKYTLSVKMISPWKEGQEFEPNDKQEHANELKLDRKVTGYIYPEDDIDWYEIRVDAKGKNILRVDLSSVPNVNSIIRICDKNGEWLKSFDVGDMGKPETVVNFGVTEGTYYIRVEAYDGENKKDKYQLSARLVGLWKEGREWELNDEIDDANRVKLNQEITGYLHPEGDADLYALTIPEPDMDVLLIELSAIPDVNSYINLLDADGEELKRADIGEEGEKETLVRMRVAPGEYYVRIYSDDANPEEIYKLRIGKWVKPPATPAEIHEALEKALDYLASSQDKQGCWRLGHYKESTGIAGLCLMAFVGSESLQKKYDPNIRATIKFIKTKYHPSSDYEPNSKDWAREGGLIYQFGGGYAPPYEHSIATLALIEAMVIMKELSLKPVIDDALQVVIRSQNTEHKPKTLNGPVKPDSEAYGGWRYHPYTIDSDISVTGWQILVLKAAINAGFKIPDWSLPKAAVFLRSCFDKESSSFQYMKGEGDSCVATGVGVLGLQLCGYPDDPLIPPPIRFMQNNPPVWVFEDPTYWHGWPFYYWYYGHRVMFNKGGEDWRIWKTWTCRMLLDNQNDDGSWDAAQREKGISKTYTTALGALMLEICGGHLPIYMRKQEDIPVMEKIVRKPGYIQVLFVKGDETETAKNVELILDASNSMYGRMDKTNKISIARKVLAEIITRLPENIHVGLRVFGHRYRPTDKRAHRDTELILPIGPIDKAKLIQTINSIKPRGKTPLVYSILQAPKDFEDIGRGTIIVITDGVETCGGDINSIAPALKKSGLELKVNIVGFDIKEVEARKQLEAIARSTGGRYLDARNPEELLSSLEETLQVEFIIVDEKGKEKARGSVGGKPVKVLEGEYLLKLMLEPEPLQTNINVRPETKSTLLLRKEKGKWYIKEKN